LERQAFLVRAEKFVAYTKISRILRILLSLLPLFKAWGFEKVMFQIVVPAFAQLNFVRRYTGIGL
jgi:hypothetical protein